MLFTEVFSTWRSFLTARDKVLLAERQESGTRSARRQRLTGSQRLTSFAWAVHPESSEPYQLYSHRYPHSAHTTQMSASGDKILHDILQLSMMCC